MNRRVLVPAAVVLALVVALVLFPRARHESETPLAPSTSLPDATTPKPLSAARTSPRELGLDAPLDRSTREVPIGGPRLRGRVVEEGTDTGVPDFRIEVEAGSLATKSDAEGRFFLELEADAIATLRVLPAHGWTIAVERYAIAPEMRQRGDELVIPAVRVSTGAWSFTLVDEATREPVPYFALLVEGLDGTSVELASDDEGVIAVGASLSGRRLNLRCRDHPDLHDAWGGWPKHSLDPPKHDAPRPELAIPVGPTYRLNIEGVPPDRRPSLRAVLASRIARLEGQPDSSAPLRIEGAAGPWVRFGPHSRPPSSGPPWLLQMSSETPALLGEVEVQHARGIHPGVLDVVLTGAGEVRGLVWNEDDDTPIVGAIVTLDAADGRPRVAPDRRTGTTADGSFRFAMVRTGSWSLGALAGGFPPASTTLQVLAGEATLHEFRLSAAVSVGEVSGTLSSVTGRFAMPVSVVLTPRAGGVSHHQDVAWEERDGRNVAPFVFEDVPLGEYRLSLAAAPLGYLWEPRAMEVLCPADDLEFVCRDDLEPIDFCIRVLDAATGQELPEMWVFVDTRVDGDSVRTSMQGPMPSGVTVGYVLPGRTKLDWVVGAPGFAPVRGDGSSLVEVSKPNGPALEAQAHLEPGWGMLLEVLESRPDGMSAQIEGAAVYADGALLGGTGADGRLLLRSARAPVRLEVKAVRWNVAAAEPFDETGRLRSAFMIHGRVWMR